MILQNRRVSKSSSDIKHRRSSIRTTKTAFCHLFPWGGGGFPSQAAIFPFPSRFWFPTHSQAHDGLSHPWPIPWKTWDMGWNMGISQAPVGHGTTLINNPLLQLAPPINNQCPSLSDSRKTKTQVRKNKQSGNILQITSLDVALAFRTLFSTYA